MTDARLFLERYPDCRLKVIDDFFCEGVRFTQNPSLDDTRISTGQLLSLWGAHDFHMTNVVLFHVDDPKADAAAMCDLVSCKKYINDLGLAEKWIWSIKIVKKWSASDMALGVKGDVSRYFGVYFELYSVGEKSPPVVQTKSENRFPHTCRLCKQPAYFGFNHCECSNKTCPGGM